jgi:hypothetical protein
MKTKCLFLLFMVFSMAFAQAPAQDVESMVQPLISSITGALGTIGLLPRFDVCGEGVEKCNLLGSPQVRAFFIILIMLWMVLNVVLEMRPLLSAIFSFGLSSLMFTHLPSLFSIDVMGLFGFVFSGLFIFIWMDYILRFLWGFSSTTKLLLNISVTMIGMIFMSVLSIFEMISFWLSNIVSGWGIIFFFIFMFAMRIVNAYVGLLSVGPLKQTKIEGARSEVLVDATKAARDRYDAEQAGIEQKVNKP